MLRGHLRKLVPRRNNSQEVGQPLLGYSVYIEGKPKGRAILSYLTQPVRDELSGKAEIEFSNRGIARSLPRALNEIGYIVHIVEWDNDNFSTKETYDLLVQHGGINYD